MTYLISNSKRSNCSIVPLSIQGVGEKVVQNRGSLVQDQSSAAVAYFAPGRIQEIFYSKGVSEKKSHPVLQKREHLRTAISC